MQDFALPRDSLRARRLLGRSGGSFGTLDVDGSGFGIAGLDRHNGHLLQQYSLSNASSRSTSMVARGTSAEMSVHGMSLLDQVRPTCATHALVVAGVLPAAWACVREGRRKVKGTSSAVLVWEAAFATVVGV